MTSLEEFVVATLFYSLIAGAMLYGYRFIADPSGSIVKEVCGFLLVLLLAFFLGILISALQNDSDLEMSWLAMFMISWVTLATAVPRIVYGCVRGGQLSIGFFFRMSGYIAVLVTLYRMIPDEAFRFALVLLPSIVLFFVTAFLAKRSLQLQVLAAVPLSIIAGFACGFVAYEESLVEYVQRIRADVWEDFVVPSYCMFVVYSVCVFFLRSKPVEKQPEELLEEPEQLSPVAVNA
jgi:hypothetical protein